MTMNELAGRHILLGVAAGIAAYKAAYLCRRLKEAGADVWVSMTRSATHFITPLTMETLSEREVLIEMFPANRFVGTRHIDVAQWTDLAVIAPATADFIGRYANGLADDMLTTLLISTTAPVLIAPAMNTDMYNHAAVQQNMATLRQRGVYFVDPTVGELACKTYGVGRMAEPEVIAAEAARLLGQSQVKDLSGATILVTAGPTREPLDPVRYLSNRSSGKMGYALAEAAQKRGARVILVSGPTALATPPGVERVDVETAQQMHDAVMTRLADCSAVIAVAAVSDWRAKDQAAEKLPKADGPPKLKLEATPDILGAVGARKSEGQYVVGFSLETDEQKLASSEKLTAKNLDLLVANNPMMAGSEFGGDSNEAILALRDGTSERPGLLSKHDLAQRILDHVAAGLATKTKATV
jgi:phosphopantothenoylcysteine decarboxylase/phosphopantothenate--cysteine ligase